MLAEGAELAALPEPVAPPCGTAKLGDFEWAPHVRNVPSWEICTIIECMIPTG